jgi:hypothetical protein
MVIITEWDAGLESELKVTSPLVSECQTRVDIDNFRSTSTFWSEQKVGVVFAQIMVSCQNHPDLAGNKSLKNERK